MLFHLLLVKANKGVEESIDTTFTLNSPADLIGVVKHPTHFTLYEKSNEKTRISFSEQNPYDNWSFEFELNVPTLNYKEEAGIYLWYTPHTQKEYLDGAKFVGLVTSIQFYHENAKITISIHENEERKIVRDYLPIEIFKDIDKIIFKTIHTSKNMKVELYNDNNLLYDHIRLLDSQYFGKHTKGGYFGITAGYEDINEKDVFHIYSAKLNKRTETDDYNVFEEKTKIGDTEVVEKREMAATIADINKFARYFNIVVGKKQEKTILENIIEARSKNYEIKPLLEELSEILNTSKPFKIPGILSKMNLLEEEIIKINKTINDLVFSVIAQKNTLKYDFFHIVYIMFMFFITIYFWSPYFKYFRKGGRKRII